MILTAERLIEIGFTKKRHKEMTYFQKDNMCLFLINGVWALGSDFGALATSNIYVNTEEELIKMMQGK